MSKKIQTQAAFKRSAAIFMAFVCALSILAITGWLFNQPILASFRPEYIPMTPDTALLFLGLFGAWFIHAYLSARRGMKNLIRVGLVGMLIIIIILAFRYLSGLGPDLENLLYPRPPLVGQFSSAHMSPLTAMGFFLAIPAFLLFTWGRSSTLTRNASTTLDLVLSILSSVGILCYLSGALPFYGGTLIPVALTSIVSFWFFSLGLLMSAGPTAWPANVFIGPSLQARLMRAFIPASILIVLIQGYLNEVTASRILHPALRVVVAMLVAIFIFIPIIFLIARNLSAEIERGKQAEEALRKSEKRYRGLFENSPVSLWEEDFSAVKRHIEKLRQQGITDFREFFESHPDVLIECINEIKVLDVNAATLTLVQAASKGQLIGNLKQVIPIEAGKDFVDEFVSIAEGQTEFEWEGINYTLDGKKLTVSLKWSAAPGYADTLEKVMLSVIDITVRKQMQNLQEAVYRIAAATETTQSLDELYFQIHQIISSVMPAENFFIALYDKDQNLLRFPYFKDAEDEPIIGRIQPGKGLTAYVLMTGKPLLCTQAVHDELERQGEVKLLGVPSAIWLGVPLIVEGKTIGAMVVQHYSDPKAYGEREQHMLEFVSTQVAIAINRKRAEDALRQSEAELRALFASMRDVVLVIDSHGVYLKIAPTNPEQLAKPPDELLGKNLWDVFQPDQADTFISAIKQVLDTKQTAQIEYDLIIGDRTVWFAASISPMTEDSTLWVAHDITARKRFESVQNALYRITQTAITSEGMDALYRSIHSILGELIPAENFFIALVDPISGLLSFPYYIDQHDKQPVGMTPQQGLTGYIIRTGRPLLITRTIFDQLVQQGDLEPVGTVAVNWMGAPLKVEGALIGVMAVQIYTPGMHYDQEDLNLLEFVSSQVAQAIERKRMEEEIRNLSLTDELTGLYNRRGFTLLAEQEVKLSHRMNRTMLLFFCDVDNLKGINDAHGHAQGDLALQEISAILRETFREVDILARLGGDEFVVLAVDASLESAENITNRIQTTLEKRNQQGDRPYQLILSMGIARYDPEAPCSVSELIVQADDLMYQQKQGKKEKK